MANDLKVLPHNYEAEMSLLGSMFIDSNLASDIIADLQPEDFYSETNRLVLEAMASVYAERKPIDYVTVMDELERRSNAQKVGGLDYLSSLANMVPSAVNYKTYFDIVKRDSLRRKLIYASQDIVENSLKSESEAEDVLNDAEKWIFDIGAKNQRSFPTPISVSVSDTIDRFSKYEQDHGAARGLPTGIAGLDNILNGLHNSDLIIVAARPGMGKTSLAMNIVEHAAIYGGASCAVFSLEMSKEQLAQRMLCSVARVRMDKALKGDLDPSDWSRIWAANEKLAKTKIFIDDTAAIKPSEILTKCRRLKAKEGLDLIMIDYIGLMSGATSAKENRQQEISEYSRTLKMIAKELNIPVLALSQLSRLVTQRKTAEPMLSDLRDSGAIEQDADIILFIYDPTVTQEGGEALTGASLSNDRVISIAKHRNGRTDKINVKWIGEYVRFENPDYRPDPSVTNKISNSVQNADEAPDVAYDESAVGAAYGYGGEDNPPDEENN